jgi:hypothetical protein
VDEEIEFSDAEIVAVPAATAVARPWLPAALLIVATDCVSESQVTEVVMFCVELSENLPVAVNCCVDPAVIVGDCGEIEIEIRTAGVTVSVADPEMLPEVAVMDAVPAATAVASPCDPETLLIVATVVLEELQVDVVVMFCVLPSLK